MKTIKDILMEDECVATGIKIYGIGDFEIRFCPDEDVTYEDLLERKSYIAQKMIEQVNKIYRFCERSQ